MSKTPRVYLPGKEWSDLGVRRRRQVRRAARRGERHADPYAAAVADAWARQVLRRYGDTPRERHLVLKVLVALVLVVAGALLQEPFPGYSLDLGGGGRERRLARRIIALSATRL